ncbi:MAG TPA: hypothetical protein VGC92_11320 [Phenylobacterium sp.]
MSLRFQTSRLAPWTGLFVGAAAWFADHQISSDADYWDCKSLGGPFAVIVGVVCIAIAAAGGIASWRLRPEAQAEEAQSRTFARFVGAGSAAIFILAIAFGTWAGVLLPGCHR